MGLHRLRRIRRQGVDLWSNDGGATAIEYTLIVAVLAVTVFGSMQVLREPMTDLFNTVSSGFASAR